jgi:YggT family protein
MILLANIMKGVAAILGSLIFVAQILIIARVVVSWVNADPRNKLVQIILGSTEPLFAPLRRRFPLVVGSLDLTPLVVIFALVLFQYVLVDSLNMYAAELLVSSRIPISTM